MHMLRGFKSILLIGMIGMHVILFAFAASNPPPVGGGKISHSQQFNQLTADELLQRVADELKKKRYTLSVGMARTTDRTADQSTRLVGYERTIPFSLSYRWNDAWTVGFMFAERVSNTLCLDPVLRVQGLGHTFGLNATYALLPWLTAIGGFLQTTHSSTLWVQQTANTTNNPEKSTLKAFTGLLGLQAFLPLPSSFFVMPVWSVTATHNRIPAYLTVLGQEKPTQEKQIYQNSLNTRLGFYKWGVVVPYVSAGVSTPFKVHNLKTRHTGQVGTGAIIAGFFAVEWLVSKTPSFRKTHTLNTNLTIKF